MKKYLKPFCLLFALMLIVAPLSACAEKKEITSAPPLLAPPEESLPQIPSEEQPLTPPETEPPLAEEPPAEQPQPEPERAQYLKVLAKGVNLREGAGTQYAVIAQAEQNTLLSFEKKQGSWYQTYYQNKIVYISANEKYTKLVTFSERETRIEEVIFEGTKLLGTPYVYGAVRFHDGKGNKLKHFTTEKFDCSSLMQYIFYHGANVNLDVTTRTQIKQGIEVRGDDLQRGDLLFFTNEKRFYNTGNERVGHVGLYLGNNYMLHTASDYAKIEVISSERWGYYLSARRYL